MDDKTMTPEQIANFRKVLVGMLGPYALIMPAEQVVAMRDRLQSNIDKAAADIGKAMGRGNERNA